MTRPRRPVVTLKRLETIKRVLDDRLMSDRAEWRRRDIQDAWRWTEGMIAWKESRESFLSRRRRERRADEGRHE